jgi:tetratricopeptide (TPR) repeat protein
MSKCNGTLILISIIIGCGNLLAQNPMHLDSIWNLCSSAKHDTTRINLLISIGEIFENSYPDSSLYYYSKAQEIAEKNSKTTLSASEKKTFTKLNANSLRLIGVIYYGFGTYDVAIDYYQKSIKLQEEIGDRRGMSESLNSIGIVYNDKGDYPNALDFYYKSLIINEEIADINGIAKCYNNIGIVYRYQGLPDKAIEYYLKSIELKEKINDKTGLADSYSNIGNIHYDRGSYDLAIEIFLKVLAIFTDSGDKKGMARNYLNIGNIKYIQGSTDKALDYYILALKIYEELSDIIGTSSAHNNIGIIYHSQGAYEKAIEHYQMVLKIAEISGDKPSIARSYNNIGRVLSSKGSYKEAVESYNKSLEIRQQLGDKKGITGCYNNLGVAYKHLNLHAKSLEYYHKSLAISVEMNDKNAMATTYQNIASLNNLLADSIGISEGERNTYLNQALDYGHKAFLLADEMGAIPSKNTISNTLMKAYSKLGNYKKAFEYSEIYNETKDSIFNSEKTKAVAEMQTKYETEKKQQEIEKQKLIIEKQDIDNHRQRTQRNFSIAGSLLLAMFALVVLRGYQQKKRSNSIITEKNLQLEHAFEEIKASSEALTKQNFRLNEQFDEISNQRNEIENQKNSLANLAWELQEKGEEIEQQKNILALQNKEITDSIRYAQRIQNAVLPNSDYLKQLFSDYFILHKPKSIVSGDFYWATQVREFIVFCITDCTGHGVPGAFMSMMGVSFLNEIVRKEELTNAAKVLNVLREHVIAALVEQDESYVQFDGMDIGLCVLNTNTLKLQYAGANIPCWIATDSPNEKVLGEKVDFQYGLIELKPDRMPIARFDRMNLFSCVDYQLKKGDTIYISSDGYADQFGGPDGKKFQKHRLMKLIYNNQNLPILQQKSLLNSEFEAWRRERNQLDDVTVLGIKV